MPDTEPSFEVSSLSRFLFFHQKDLKTAKSSYESEGRLVATTKEMCFPRDSGKQSDTISKEYRTFPMSAKMTYELVIFQTGEWLSSKCGWTCQSALEDDTGALPPG